MGCAPGAAVGASRHTRGVTPDPASDVVSRARALLDAGRTWKARDLLTAHVEAERDVEALTLLGHVQHGMGDLPKAGAAWFAAGVRGPEADEAVAAWREHSRDDFGVMWRSLPVPFREEPRPARIEALHERALTSGGELEPMGSALVPDTGSAPGDGADADEGDGMDAAQVVSWIVAAAFVVCAVIGFVTVLGWMVPG